MGGTPIIDAKITVPHQHRNVVDRPAARALLDRGERVGVTVVAAAPGYLKRQLVASWAQADPRRTVAWVSLDAGDDPARLLAHTMASIRRVQPGFAPDLDVASLIGGPGWEVRAVDTVIEAFGRETSPITVVFDSVHSLVHPDSLHGLGVLIRYRPPALRVVALTRDDAALDLSTAVLAGSVVEIREDDLAFDAEQTFEAVIAATGRAWTKEQAGALHLATAGWPAGVFLTAVRQEPGGPPPPFGTDEEPVRSYLRHRVLDPLEPELRSFLLHVAPLGDVSAELCAHVTGRADTGHLLDRLVELHLLGDGRPGRPGWRRFPSFVASFAEHELRAADTDEARSVHQIAARWCWEQELLEESMHIAASGGQTQLMAEILLEHHHRWSAGGEAEAVRRWCSTLLQADPQLVEAQLASAWASLFLSDDEFAMSTVALITALDLPGDRGTFVRGELAMIRAHVARRRGDMVRSLRDVREGVECARALPEDYQTPYRGALPGALHLHVGVAAVWAGELDEAVAELTDAQRETNWSRQALPAIHGHLAVALWLLGDKAARAHAEVALTHVRDDLLGPADFTALCMGLILGVGPDGPRLDQALSLAEAIDEPIAQVLVRAAEVSQVATVDRARALEALRRIRIIVKECPAPGALTAVCNQVAQEIGTDRDATLGDPLTGGEERVLRMLVGSLTEREIASELHLSHNTVRTYRRRLYKKLGVASRSEAARVARLRPS